MTYGELKQMLEKVQPKDSDEIIFTHYQLNMGGMTEISFAIKGVGFINPNKLNFNDFDWI